MELLPCMGHINDGCIVPWTSYVIITTITNYHLVWTGGSFV